MYFLTQIKHQFFAQLALHEVMAENTGGRVDDVETLEEADQRLAVLEATSRIAGRELEIILRGLEKVLSQNTATQTEEERSEINNLLQRIQRLKGILEETKQEGRQIDEGLKQAMLEGEIHQIREGIAGITEVTDEDITLLEAQRREYIATIQQEISQIPASEQEAFSQDTKRFITLLSGNQDLVYPTEADTNEEKKDYLTGIILPALIENQRQLTILLRDERGRQAAEQPGELRNNAVIERYTALYETFTEAQKAIIDGRSFEELRVADFQKLWLQEGVDISSIFLRTETGAQMQAVAGESLIISFGGNPEIANLLPSLLPLRVNAILIDGRVANRVGETRFEYEGGLPISVSDGSNIVLQSIEDLPPPELAARTESFEEVLRSNEGRQQMEEQVESSLRGRSLEERTGESDIDFLKRIINILAVKFGFGEIFASQSEADLQAIAENGGMQRFIPNGAEILNDAAFMTELQAMSGRLGVQRDHMLVVMQAECGLNHQAVNPTSGASGLIQFMPSTARGLGTTVEAIRQMSPVQQLVYVEKYFENYKGRMHSVEDIYRVVFYPAAIGKPDDWVFGSQNNTAGVVARQNGVIARHSTRADGLIDNRAFARYVQAKVGQYMTMDYSGASGATANLDGISAESLQALPENRRKVVGTALEAQARGDILGAAHCTDWVDKIYQREIGKSVYSAAKLFDGDVYDVGASGRDTGLRVREYADAGVISQVQPGDHIMVDHGPGFGQGRTHSVIALESPNDGILRVVSYPNGGRPPRIELYDLTGQGRGDARPEKAMRIHTPV